MNIKINMIDFLKELDEFRKNEENQGIFRENIEYEEINNILLKLSNNDMQKDKL